MPAYAYIEPGFREEFDAETDTAADEIARGMLRSGEYEQNDPPSTFRVSCHLARLGPGGVEDDSWTVTETIDPDEPPCPVRNTAGHDWSGDHQLVGGLTENPGVFSSGHGQVKTVEACAACGARKTDDLGGTDRATGDNMRVITYEPPGTVIPPGLPVYWSLCSGTFTADAGSAVVQPEAAGVDVPAGVLAWAESHGLAEDNPDLYLVVATEDTAQVDVPGEVEWIKGTVTYAEDKAIRAAVAARTGEGT